MPDQAGPAGRPGRAVGADGPIQAGTPADDDRSGAPPVLDPGLRAEIDAIVERIRPGDYRLRSLVHEIVQSKMFQSK